MNEEHKIEEVEDEIELKREKNKKNKQKREFVR